MHGCRDVLSSLAPTDRCASRSDTTMHDCRDVLSSLASCIAVCPQPGAVQGCQPGCDGGQGGARVPCQHTVTSTW